VKTAGADPGDGGGKSHRARGAPAASRIRYKINPKPADGANEINGMGSRRCPPGTPVLATA